MKKLLLIVVCVVGLAAAAWASQPRTVELLVAQSGTSFAVEGDVLTIQGVPNTLVFTDRPERLAGTMNNAAFAELWNSDAMAEDPPNAVLSMPGEAPVNVVVELISAPRVEGDALSYRIKVLHGALPDEGGPCALFIDAFPTSVNDQITDSIT